MRESKTDLTETISTCWFGEQSSLGLKQRLKKKLASNAVFPCFILSEWKKPCYFQIKFLVYTQLTRKCKAGSSNNLSWYLVLCLELSVKQAAFEGNVSGRRNNEFWQILSCSELGHRTFCPRNSCPSACGESFRLATRRQHEKRSE